MSTSITEARIIRALEAIAVTVEAGVAMSNLLANAAATAEIPAPILQALHRSSNDGVPLSEALFPTGLFRPHELAILNASERVGSLHVGLRAVAAAIKRRIDDRRTLIGGIAYPTLLLIAASVILPLPLIFTQGPLAYVMRAFWLPALLLSAVFVFFWWLPRLPATDVRRAWPRRIASRLPFLRAAARSAELSDYCNVLGTALGAGIGVDEAITSAARAVELPALRNTRSAILGRLRKGDRLADAMQSTGAFDTTLIGVVAQGELVGSVSDSFISLGVVYADEAKRRFRRILMVSIGLLYACVVVFIGYQIVNAFTQVLTTMEQSMEFE